MTRTRVRGAAAPAVDGGRLDVDAVRPGVQADLAGSYFRLLSPILNAAADRSMADNPIGPGVGKISTLQAIASNPGISQMELSEMFGRDRSLQFRIVTDLEKRGLVWREVDPTEKRRHRLYATEAGMALMPEIDSIIRQNDRDAFAMLTDAEYEVLTGLLRRVFLGNLGGGSAYWRSLARDTKD